MKKEQKLILIMVFGIVFLFSMIPLVNASSPVTVLSDDFDSYTTTNDLANVWTIYNAVDCNTILSQIQTISQPNSVQFIDLNITNDQSWTGIYRDYEKETQFIYVSFYIGMNQINGDFRMTLRDTSGKHAIGVGIGEYGMFEYSSSSAWYSSITYNAYEWYLIEVFYDVKQNNYTVMVNYTYPICEDVPTNTVVDHVNRISFHTGEDDGSGNDIFYIDDVLIVGQSKGLSLWILILIIGAIAGGGAIAGVVLYRRRRTYYDTIIAERQKQHLSEECTRGNEEACAELKKEKTTS